MVLSDSEIDNLAYSALCVFEIQLAINRIMNNLINALPDSGILSHSLSILRKEKARQKFDQQSNILAVL